MTETLTKWARRNRNRHRMGHMTNEEARDEIRPLLDYAKRVAQADAERTRRALNGEYVGIEPLFTPTFERALDINPTFD